MQNISVNQTPVLGKIRKLATLRREGSEASNSRQQSMSSSQTTETITQKEELVLESFKLDLPTFTGEGDWINPYQFLYELA